MRTLKTKHSAVPACRQTGLSGRIDNMYYVYILQSQKDNGFYTGLTNDVDRRLQEHNSGQCKPTKSRVPFVIIYKEETSTLRQARKREKFLKSGIGREFRDSVLKLQNIPR